MLRTALFVIGSVSPVLFFVVALYAFRGSAAWLRSVVMVVALLLSFPFGVAAVATSIEPVVPGRHHTAGVGVVLIPLLGVWCLALIGVLAILLADFWSWLRQRRG
jgi:hypothetical protein